MDVSMVNNYQGVAAIASTSTNNTTVSQQNTALPSSTVQTDTVTISSQGQALSQPDHKLRTDPIELFMEWKSRGGTGAEIGRVQKPINQLLPENQKLIAQLREQEKTMSPEERKLTEYSRISVIRQYGDQEIFTSAADADKRLKAQSQACSLEMAYLTKTGHAPIFEHTLSDINGGQVMETGYVNNTVPQRVQDLSNMLSNNPVSKFDDPNFLADYLRQAYDSDYYQRPATTKAPWQ